MDVLSLESVIVVEPPRVDERHVAFAVAGDDLLIAGTHFFGQFGEPRANLIQGTMSFEVIAIWLVSTISSRIR